MIFSYPKEHTVRIFVMDSMMMLEESLYVYSAAVADPDRNAIRIAPAAIKNGVSPRETKAVLH